ncbi:virulence factor TspB C-terminal domain-related protein [Kingella kingae]|uniref:virulence factor TspB C-terminal domain-related protein n=14 Tax=Kingella kingae TaxID=504 RepID=UPI0025559B3A|nr:virulence factor TspB C-terminal domain-related protein [Kingella kingae]MDK4672940.1 virulence factor TspB C-terminal domain-related protein [Kingella kingae]
MRFNHLFYITALMSLFLFTAALAKAADLPTLVVYGSRCEGKSDGVYKSGNFEIECVGGKLKRKKDLHSTTPKAPTSNNNNSGNSTGGTTATGNNSGSGNSSNTTQKPPTFVCAPNMPPEKCNGNGNGSGSDANSDAQGSESNSKKPDSNTPTPPYNLPPEKLKKLNEELASLARMYQQELKKLEGQKLSAKSSYESSVVACHGQYQSYGAAAIKNCVDSAKKKFDDEIAELDKKMAEKVDMFNQAVKDLYAAYGVDIGTTPNVTAPNVPNATGSTDVVTDSNGNKFCKINGTWQFCGGNANTNGGAGTTTNTTTNNTTTNNTSNDSSNTTVNNNTTVVNNGGSGASSGNGSGANSNSSGEGKGKGEEGEGFFDGFCKRNPDTFFCAKADRAAINKAAEGSDDEKVETGLKQTDDQLAQSVSDKIKEFRDSKKVDALKRYVYKQFVGHETAACPAPLSFTTFGNRVVFSWQFFCDFLHLIRKFVIGIFALLTMFFVVGNLR